MSVTERLITARDVADLLGMTPGWVLDQWQAGRLPGYRYGGKGSPVRFRLSEIEAWLEARRGGPQAA
jgi:excisionase family DNA binding protein